MSIKINELQRKSKFFVPYVTVWSLLFSRIEKFAVSHFCFLIGIVVLILQFVDLVK